MDVLVGECTGPKWESRIRGRWWGRMWIARNREIYTYPGEPWGLDNGAFRDWKDGTPFDGDQYRRVLDKAVKHPPPMLAVIPDKPGDARATIAMAHVWRPQLPECFPWYLAVQDGMTPDDMDSFGWISGIFLGGTNSYKATAGMWCQWAHDHGLKFHYGRAGTHTKVAHAFEVEADSLDSAFPMWTRWRWKRFVSWVEHGPEQHDLFWGKR